MRRELAIALRSRLTWIVAVLSALLTGHGFILAIDLFSASSRSALASALQAREMDPLAGIVRPTLGGLDLSLVLLGPLVAARPLSIEKERGTFGALCLAVGSPGRVVLSKATAALAACGLLFSAPLLLLLGFRLSGGHLDFSETAVAFGGELLRTLVIVGASVAAATWTSTLAQAATLGIAVALTSWAIDAAEGFAALAWLGGASAWSLEQKLGPFQKGIVPLGSVLWLSIATVLAVTLAILGASFDRRPAIKWVKGLAVLVVGAVLLSGTTGVRRAYDWTEERRASLPPAVVEGLRAIDGPLAIDVYLDRDDSRRHQLESDVLTKLILARPDAVVRTPLDNAPVAEAQRDSDYGRLIIRAGEGERETRSASRKEIVTLVFEAAGRPLPNWEQPAYPGFPVVLDGAARRSLVIFAYLVVPLLLLVIGLYLSQRRTTR
jgi:ABC-type transport system involved in multi-copper enzyme maturation permease subunit